MHVYFVVMDHNNDEDNNEAMMNIIAGGGLGSGSNVQSYTEEERTEADQFLNISAAEDSENALAADNMLQCSGEV